MLLLCTLLLAALLVELCFNIQYNVSEINAKMETRQPKGQVRCLVSSVPTTVPEPLEGLSK